MQLLSGIGAMIAQSSGTMYPQNVRDMINRSLPGGANGTFSNMLSSMNGQAGGQLTLPTPPTPPANASDPAAQEQYNQALLAYNQNFQRYHTQVLQLMSQRFAMMQQNLLQQQRAVSTLPSKANGGDTSETREIGSLF
jgi:hypothetical protein